MARWKPPRDLDRACESLCVAMNALPGIRTTSSCCGHGEEAYRIWFEMNTKKMGAVVLSRCLSGRYYNYAKGERRLDPVWRVYLDDTEGPSCFVLEGKPMGSVVEKVIRTMRDRSFSLLPRVFRKDPFGRLIRLRVDHYYAPAELLAFNLMEYVVDDYALGKKLFQHARRLGPLSQYDENGDDVLVDLLSKCSYREDIEAAMHFVFHPRLNGASNSCLLCQRGVDIDDHLLEHGHAEDCPYLEAIKRVRESERVHGTLDDWLRRQ